MKIYIPFLKKIPSWFPKIWLYEKLEIDTFVTFDNSVFISKGLKPMTAFGIPYLELSLTKEKTPNNQLLEKYFDIVEKEFSGLISYNRIPKVIWIELIENSTGRVGYLWYNSPVRKRNEFSEKVIGEVILDNEFAI